MKISRTMINLLVSFVTIAGTVIVLTTIFYMGFGNGTSMEPTMGRLNWMVAYRLDHKFERGDIIIAQPKNWSNEQVAKRILGIPGDRIIIDGIKMYVNDVEIDTNIDSDSFKGYGYQAYTLGAHEYFIVGDNYMDSYDSRARGPIHVKDIIAKVLFWINL